MVKDAAKRGENAVNAVFGDYTVHSVFYLLGGGGILRYDTGTGENVRFCHYHRAGFKAGGKNEPIRGFEIRIRIKTAPYGENVILNSVTSDKLRKLAFRGDADDSLAEAPSRSLQLCRGFRKSVKPLYVNIGAADHDKIVMLRAVFVGV